jgi:hypothetical protein
MDDLEDLKARVAAAQEKLRLSADDQRKYGLRLNDVVTIVEGSLARQQDEMKRLQDSAVQLRLERDATRFAENQTKSLYEAALSRLNLLQSQNEQLRSMIMTLLNVIEGRESAGALQGVLQRLESTAHEIAAAAPAVAETADKPAPVTAAAPAAPSAEIQSETAVPVESAADEAADEAEIAEEESGLDADDVVLAEDLPEETPLEDAVEVADASEDAIAEEANLAEAEAEEGIAEESAAEEAIAGESIADEALEVPAAASEELTDDDQVTDIALEDDAEPAVLQQMAANSDDEELDLVSDDIPEDLGELSMKAHHDIVTDADAMVSDEGANQDEAEIPAPAAKSADQPAVNGKQDETLVTALLDAEKALIEAGASGVANVNSPVAEIIRRISLRTREFSEASGV